MVDLNLGDTQKIISECKRQNLTKTQTAYVLATAYHETAHTMKPVREAFWLSEAWRVANLRYYPYYGRGYVQLTWKYNYEKASDKLGVDLTKDLDKAMETKNAVPILVFGMKEGWFTGKKLGDYISEEQKDYIYARKIVNGLDKAQTIASLARQYEEALSNFDKVTLVDFIQKLIKLLREYFK